MHVHIHVTWTNTLFRLVKIQIIEAHETDESCTCTCTSNNVLNFNDLLPSFCNAYMYSDDLLYYSPCVLRNLILNSLSSLDISADYVYSSANILYM